MGIGTNEDTGDYKENVEMGVMPTAYEKLEAILHEGREVPIGDSEDPDVLDWHVGVSERRILDLCHQHAEEETERLREVVRARPRHNYWDDYDAPRLERCIDKAAEFIELQRRAGLSEDALAGPLRELAELRWETKARAALKEVGDE